MRDFFSSHIRNKESALSISQMLRIMPKLSTLFFPFRKFLLTPQKRTFSAAPNCLAEIYIWR